MKQLCKLNYQQAIEIVKKSKTSILEIWCME